MTYLQNVVTLEFFPERCTGCRRCIEVCPRGVFEMYGMKVVVEEKDNCIECGACWRNCAFGAIRVKSGVGCAAAVINGLLRGGDPSCGCGETASSSCCC